MKPQDLLLPEYINKLGVDLTKCKGQDVPKNTETCRVLHQIYYYLKYSRTCLIQANKQDDDIFMRCMSCNTSIIWHQNCFDLLLQAIWLYNEYYTKTYTSKKNQELIQVNNLTTTNINTILEKCRWSLFAQIGIDKGIYDKLCNFRTKQSKIRGLSNKLKHHNGIIYFENNVETTSVHTDFHFDFSKSSFIENSSPDKHYNSIKTANREALPNIIIKLCEYHTEFCDLLKTICLHLGIATEE